MFYYKNNYIDVFKFNYSGVCGDVFKYGPNTKRDLVIGSYDFKNKCIRESVFQALEMTRIAMPDCRIVFLLFSLIPSTCVGKFKRLSDLQVETYKVTRHLFQDAVVFRFIAFRNYITKHINEIDRVVIIDFRDVLFFADFFRTFGANEVNWLLECYGTNDPNDCFGPANFPEHARWIRRYISSSIADDFVQRNISSLNGGFAFGGVENIKEVLNILCDNMDWEKMMWEYDQALLNVLYYTGKFENVGLQAVACQQRVCYIGINGFRVENKVIYWNNTLCSTVATHKFTTNSTHWRVR
ncbi:hypothetical protein EIN_198950 [Entamoeba invadens IP1]|uniref:Uncharacterized protein n=1 Tax=Entamoeba invadens IP1 TaxID=370355 RepID=A0A0A1U9P1_ENTIV|nr:hypothetical protein EIN_198950 [Entamoeba invadens IP1]ELP89836.1 hypothetical protein EIN_198950 [Entamoeba invadens IP1]|eukprot:XP_004256607.1 hypothetical protein EIN_198950 [Entamoeba invadens IP1]